ncbi:MAG TPA: MFS transporter [bacterium]|nr:MFS transporter [bacterium]
MTPHSVPASQAGPAEPAASGAAGAAPPSPSARIVTGDFLKLFVAVHFSMNDMSLYNLLPYYMQLRGVTPHQYGLVAGTAGVATFVCMLLFGRWADRGSRKALVLAYLAVCLVGDGVAVLAMHGPWQGYFLCRTLHGAYLGLGFPLVFSWAVDQCSPRQRYVVLAWMGIAGIFSNSLGPILAEALLAWQGRAGDPDSFLPVFLMGSAFSVAAWLMVASARDVPVQGRRSGGLLILVSRRESLLCLLVTFALGGMFASLVTFGKNYTIAQELSFVSVLLVAYSAGAILSRVLIRQIVSRVPEHRLGGVGLTILVPAFLLLGFAGNYPALTLSGLLYGLGHGVLYPTLYVRFLDYQQAGQLGRASIVFQGAFNVGAGIFLMAGGALVQRAGFSVYFWLLAAIAAACIPANAWAEALWRRRTARARLA